MSLFRKIKRALLLSFCRKKKQQSFLPKNKLLVLRADGSWILDDDVSSPEAKLPNVPSWSHQPQPALPLNYNQYAPKVDESLDEPPQFFPHAQELTEKLNECATAGVVSGCTHLKTKDGIYVLTIELPRAGADTLNSTHVNLFIRAMKEKYGLDLARKETFSSAVSCHKYYTLVFEYDPRRILWSGKK